MSGINPEELYLTMVANLSYIFFLWLDTQLLEIKSSNSTIPLGVQTQQLASLLKLRFGQICTPRMS